MSLPILPPPSHLDQVTRSLSPFEHRQLARREPVEPLIFLFHPALVDGREEIRARLIPWVCMRFPCADAAACCA
jgi:hypothetical protein